MSAWLIWRVVKFLGVALFAGGVLTTLAVGPRADRMRAFHALVTPGLLASWIAGYALMKLAGNAIEPWILAGALFSLLSFHGAMLQAHKPEPRAATAWVALLGLLASVGVMVFRAEGEKGLLFGALVPSLAAPLIRAALPRPAPSSTPEDQAAALAWFQWIARFEGLSLILLMVGMPLRKMAGIHLDGGTGLLGWTHGALFLVYLQALLSVGRLQGWGWGTLAGGFVASVLPFGTFVFERRVGKG